MHRMLLTLSLVKALFWLRLGCGIPSISTVCTQAQSRCAQVIHMFVHRQQRRVPARRRQEDGSVLSSTVGPPDPRTVTGCGLRVLRL